MSAAPHPAAGHPSVVIDEGAEVGEETRIWHFSHVMGGARIGARCSLGQGCFVGDGAILGSGVKVQNNVSIYGGTTIEDAVFLGPSCVFTNVSNPRAEVNRRTLYEPTLVRRGATIGANATIVCGVSIGRYAFVAAGAVVTSDIPDYGRVLGVPGRLSGYVSRHLHPLDFDDEGLATCRESGLRYSLEGEHVRCLDLSEDSPLPEELQLGARAYREFE